jgi:hypothetical protein
MVFVGTNNELVRDKNQGGDRGVLMAFRASASSCGSTPIKLNQTRQRLAVQGVASSPLVEPPA